eukprot:4911083-Prymnesium_polylepis.1
MARGEAQRAWWMGLESSVEARLPPCNESSEARTPILLQLAEPLHDELGRRSRVALGNPDTRPLSCSSLVDRRPVEPSAPPRPISDASSETANNPPVE